MEESACGRTLLHGLGVQKREVRNAGPGQLGGEGSGLRLCGAQRFSGDMRVQGDSLSCRVRGRDSSCHSLVPTTPGSSCL